MPKLDISTGTMFRAILILIGFWFLYLILDIILMLFAAIIIASVIEPIANYFERYRIPRALTVALVYALLILVLVGVLTLLIEPLSQQVTQLASAAPHMLEALDRMVQFIVPLGQVDISSHAQEALIGLGDNLANISLNVVERTRTFVGGIFTLLFVFVLAFYLVVERDALRKFFRLVTPRQHLPYVEQIVTRAQYSVSRWLIAQLTLGAIVGVLVGLGLWIIGVRYALLLGLVAGLLEIVPVMGPVIAAIPGVVVGLSQSLWLGIIALGFYILVQQFENHVLVPNMMRRAVGLNPLVTIIAVLLGARLAGVVGVILSVPLAAVLSLVLSDVFSGAADEELAG